MPPTLAMTIKGLHHFNIRAHPPLLDEIKDFYVHVIGLREGFRPPFHNKGFWLYAEAAALIHLTEVGPGEPRPAKSYGTIDHLALACQDPDTYLSRLKNRGIPFLLGSVPGRRSLQIFVKDPAGNEIELNFSLTELNAESSVASIWNLQARATRSGEDHGYQVRRLTPNDAAAFQAIRLEALTAAPTSFGASLEEERDFTHEQIAARLEPRPDQTVLGAFQGDLLVGIVALVRESKRKLAHKCMLFGLYVQPGARRVGIGRELVETALSVADQTPGVLQVALAVNANNTAAISIYEQLGFQAYGLEPSALNHEGCFYDELHMKRTRTT